MIIFGVPNVPMLIEVTQVIRLIITLYVTPPLFPWCVVCMEKKTQNRGIIIAWISYRISESASFVPAHLQYVTVGLRFTSIPAPSSSCLSHSDCISRYDLSSYIYISVNPHHTHSLLCMITSAERSDTTRFFPKKDSQGETR